MIVYVVLNPTIIRSWPRRSHYFELFTVAKYFKPRQTEWRTVEIPV